MTDTFLEVGGRRVRILRSEGRAGPGAEPQLLVHGLGGSAVTWVEVIGRLSAHGPVVALDLPGFGRTPVSDRDSLTVRGYTAFVLDVADALGWDTFTLHGNSMGGLIGTLVAAECPRRVERLVLVSPAFPPRSPLGLLRPSRATIHGMAPIAASSATALALGLAGLAGPAMTARRNRALLGLIFTDPDGVNPRLLDLMAEEYAEDRADPDSPESVDRRRALLAATRSISRLWADPRSTWRAIHAVAAPTLVLGGTHDALVPARVLRAVLAARSDWQGRVLDDRRHALMLEDPDAYLRLFNAWQDGALAA